MMYRTTVKDKKSRRGEDSSVTDREKGKEEREGGNSRKSVGKGEGGRCVNDDGNKS